MIIAKEILIKNKKRISELALIPSAGIRRIDEAIDEIDRIIQLLEKINCEDSKYLEVMKILKK